MFKSIIIGLFVMFSALASCKAGVDSGALESSLRVKTFDHFVVPLPDGYDWEVTQSWKEDADYCEEKYPYNPTLPGDTTYYDSTHYYLPTCKYGWDFNLPNGDDCGVPTLASAGGTIHSLRREDVKGWGVFVVIDHGNNICTRYAHLTVGSVDHLNIGDQVCQNLKIGKIGKTGGDWGCHLHFQFEYCDNLHKSIPKEFDDENGRPICTKGANVFDANDEYDFLTLHSPGKKTCNGDEDPISDAVFDEDGWNDSDCGHIDECPLIPSCERGFDHRFNDDAILMDDVRLAANYLYSECALDGMADGSVQQYGHLTRAEALKIPLFLYGMMEDCGSSETFEDVNQEDWYFGVVACAVLHRIINSVADMFRPNDEVKFSEAAKFVVESAVKAGVIELQNPASGSFPLIGENHWAYRYVETIHHYGGTTPAMLGLSADSKVFRGDFIKMVASLSPCFCKNVRCEAGCQCNQATFSCSDPNDTGSGTGGGPDDPDDPIDDPIETPDMELDCWISSDSGNCPQPEVELVMDCDLTNLSSEMVEVDTLIARITSSQDQSVCRLTRDHNSPAAGVTILDPGETQELPGYFAFLCDSMPGDSDIDLEMDMETDDDLFSNFADVEVSVPQQRFTDCADSWCTADCQFKNCGPDGCGGVCGICAASYHCNVDQCTADCVPLCTGKQCGPDTCGGSCGTCPAGMNCENQTGQCSQPSINVEVCDSGVDEDLDGLIDCLDPDCANLPICQLAVCAELGIYLEFGGLVYVLTTDGDFLSWNIDPDTTLYIGLDASDGLTTVWLYTAKFIAQMPTDFEVWAMGLPGIATANPYPDPVPTTPGLSAGSINWAGIPGVRRWVQLRFGCP